MKCDHSSTPKEINGGKLNNAAYMVVIEMMMMKVMDQSLYGYAKKRRQSVEAKRWPIIQGEWWIGRSTPGDK